MKITVLIENTSASELVCEHGLSLLIEYRGGKYLLDAGSSDAFLENARRMGISLMDIKTCFLSHGHYDHSGGFAEFLAQNRAARVYAMRGVREEYYSASGGKMHEIGVPKNVLPIFNDRFCFADRVTQPGEGIWLIPHSTAGLEAIGERTKLYRKGPDGALIADDFSHEMSLVFETDRGLVIFNSCSHGGSLNILREAEEALPGRKPYAFVGGLHMKGRKNGEEICTFSEAEVKALAEGFEEQGLARLYTGHCTGGPGYELLHKYMGDRAVALTTGEVIEL